MKYILIILIALMTGCAAGVPKPPKAAIDYGYENIFKNEENCLSVYKKDGLYYIVKSDSKKYTEVGVIRLSPVIRVYSPQYGTAVSIKADDRLRKLQDYLSGVDSEYKCQLRDVPNWRREPGVNPQSYIISAIHPLHKDKFDKILSNLNSIDEALYLNDILEGKTRYKKNDIVSFNVSRVSADKDTTSKVVTEFLRISASDKFQMQLSQEVKMDLRDRKDREKQAAAEKRKSERQDRMRKEAQKNWEIFAMLALERGAKACTFEKNIFGYVEDVTDNRIKLYVVGQVDDKIDGYFYVLDSEAASATKIQSYRWFGKNELRRCEFNE